MEITALVLLMSLDAFFDILFLFYVLRFLILVGNTLDFTFYWSRFITLGLKNFPLRKSQFFLILSLIEKIVNFPTFFCFVHHNYFFFLTNFFVLIWKNLNFWSVTYKTKSINTQNINAYKKISRVIPKGYKKWSNRLGNQENSKVGVSKNKKQ